MVDPLHQFTVREIVPLDILGVNVSFTNSSLTMMLALLVGVTLCIFALTLKTRATKHGACIPNKVAAASEVIYNLIADMVSGISGPSAVKFIPFVFTLFIFILLCNVIGILPRSFASTSHIIVTFSIASLVFIGATIVGFIKHGFKYILILLPKGTPLALIPLLFVIELFAYLARPVSLSLRLAVNIAAGHIILEVISMLTIMSGVIAILPFILLIALFGFEFFVAALQAYIFSILTCVYLGDALNLH